MSVGQAGRRGSGKEPLGFCVNVAPECGFVDVGTCLIAGGALQNEPEHDRVVVVSFSTFKRNNIAVHSSNFTAAPEPEHDKVLAVSSSASKRSSIVVHSSNVLDSVHFATSR